MTKHNLAKEKIKKNNNILGEELNKLTNMTKINWTYIGGLLESDGTFYCGMSKEGSYLKPEIRIASKTNTNTLQDVKDFLIKEGIDCTIDKVPLEDETDIDCKKSDRAPNLRVQGKVQCSSFCKKIRENGVIMEHNNYKCSLLGNKQRDLMLMEEVCKSDSLSLAEKLDLKKTFHKIDYSENDFIGKKTIIREDFEKRLGINSGSSLNAAKELILGIDSKYQEHVIKVIDFGGKINGSYVAGLFDGDGGFNITTSVKEKEKIIAYTVDINLSLPKKDSHIFKVIQQTFDIDPVTLQIKKNSIQMKIRREDLVKKVLSYFDKYPILGDHKIEEINLIKHYHALKEAGLLKRGQADLDAIIQFFERLYEVSEKMKGPDRKELDFLKVKANEFYGPKKEE